MNRETQDISSWQILQECGDFTWRVSDCEEFVGVLTGDDWVGFGEINTAQINVVQLLRIY